MLTLLHEKINKIVPILGISENEDGSYRIDYVNEPDQAQLDQINKIIQDWPLEKLKLSKIDELNIEWTKTLNNGWATPYGWKLGLTTQDIVLLNGTFALAKEASSLGINNPISIIDTNNEAHEFNLTDLTLLLIQYGKARADLSAKYSLKINLIKEVSSIQELDQISLI